MRRRGLAGVAALVVCSAWAAPTAWSEPLGLRQNPFRAPPPPQAAQAQALPEAPPPKPWRPALRGVLLAGPDSLANVEGRILRLGDELEGHRLVAVEERRATFQNGSARVVLTLEGAGQETR